MGALSASVVAPATSANLGCAFDCAGLALNLYLRAQATVTSSPGLTVAYKGVDGVEIPTDDSNLVVQAMHHAVAWIGKNMPGKQPLKSLAGLKVDLQNEIPIGVGLGSSAAAIVAGSLLGAELCAVRLSSKDLLRMALEIEGHPDNLAAAVHGGFVVAAASEDSATNLLVAKTNVSPGLDFIAIIPGVLLPTARSRAALPKNYSRADVVSNLQRTALLTASFFSGQRLSPELFRDRLHQPYRSPLVPGIAECLEYRNDGLLGIFLSGAGSAVMAVVEHGAASIGKTNAAKTNAKIQANNAKAIGDALVALFASKGTKARALKLKADNRGTRVTGSAGPRTFPVPPSA